jgi:hypothetical protein
LQVGRRQALARVAEDLRRRHAEGQRAAAEAEEFAYFLLCVKEPDPNYFWKFN